MHIKSREFKTHFWTYCILFYNKQKQQKDWKNHKIDNKVDIEEEYYIDWEV